MNSISPPGDIVTKTIPSYLRIHQGNEPTSSLQTASSVDTVERFWNAFSDATGWRIDKREIAHNEAHRTASSRDR